MDARKESAVRGQGGGGSGGEDGMKGEVEIDIPVLTSQERIGEGDAGTEDTTNDADKIGV